MREYVTDRGDLIWLSFHPQVGHEQIGRRHALVLSPKKYNIKTTHAIACPVTSQLKGYPFEVKIPPGFSIHGAIYQTRLNASIFEIEM